MYMNDSMNETPRPTSPETRSLQDLTKDELQLAIASAAERLRDATENDDKPTLFKDLTELIRVVNFKFPEYGPDPSDGKIGARSDLDDLRLP